MDQHDLLTEMRAVREKVPGVTGTLVATSDGMLVVADVGSTAESQVEADSLAAIAAASLSVARQVVSVARQGTLGRAITYASRGHMVVYAVGVATLLAVFGDEGLDMSALHQESQLALGRIRIILNETKKESKTDDRKA
jgi:predicted regulator of Ras-like GTPase activity (Roadblock/LC7/MglB family)